MEGGGSILDAILDRDDVEDADGMMDVEEGELVGLEDELVGLDLTADSRQNVGGDIPPINQEASSHRRHRRKKKKQRKKGSSGLDVMNIDRFVLNVCKRLNERKTHLMYAAVGCLGVSALSDLIKEVDAIQACGGQKTASGTRFRNGGGILWNVLKTRDPNAYKEIMKKTREFENQFKQQIKGSNSMQNKDAASEKVHPESLNQTPSDGGGPHVQNPHNKKRTSVRDRLRVPVTYDDLLEDEGQNYQPT